MRSILLVAVLMLAGCKQVDCDQLRRERDEARMRSRSAEDGARLGDAYAAASRSYERDEAQRAERRYEEGCSK